MHRGSFTTYMFVTLSMYTLFHVRGTPVILPLEGTPYQTARVHHKSVVVAGDHGDPDLASALKEASASGRPVPLVVFGHMHHMLRGGRRSRNMVHIDPDRRTVLLNCAVVPRWQNEPIAPNKTDAWSSQFTVIHMAADGYVQSASYVWVGMHGKQCHVVSEQQIIRTQSCTHERLVRQFLVTGNISAVSNDSPRWKTVESALPSK